MKAGNVQSICSIRMCQLRNERTLSKPTHQLIEKPFPAIRYLRCGLLSFFRRRWLWISGSFLIHRVAALVRNFPIAVF